MQPYDTRQENQSLDAMRIIGVELKQRTMDGQQTELKMFECDLIVPVWRNFAYGFSLSAEYFPLTIHTNRGDINGDIGR
jgi:hypothetical protein